MRPRRWQYVLGFLLKSQVPQSSISCWAHRHDQHGLFYLGHWIGSVLSMWSMRPELVPMWMGLLSRLAERSRRGKPVVSHSVSTLHRCPRHPDSWSIDSYELCKRDHWNCNCRWRVSQYSWFWRRFKDPACSLTPCIMLRQELGETRKASYAFRHMSCPTLSMTNLTMVLVFWRRFQDHTCRLTSSIICDKSWGQPGKQATLSDTCHVRPCPWWAKQMNNLHSEQPQFSMCSLVV